VPQDASSSPGDPSPEADRGLDAAASSLRLGALLEAVTTIGSDLDLQTVLRRIAEAAVVLVDARYGALGVIGQRSDGLVLTQFITVGLDERTVEHIGTLPEGKGILGVLITDPHPLRLDDLGAHPATYGFPPGHPPMTGFLGVPIRVRDEVFGNLYLTEKRHGAFDEADEAAVQGLATAAGVAIENARLYEQTRRRERWVSAGAEVTTSLLSGTDIDDVLALVARRSRELIGADTALIALPRGGALLVEVADGPGSQDLLGRRLPGPVLPPTGAQLVSTDDAGAYGASPDGSVLLVPLGPGAQPGVLALTTPTTDLVGGELAELAAFAGQATVALELAERRLDAERVVVFEDRDRIARDLHDLVIQRLFATGMQLESVLRLIDRPEVRTRVHAAVDDLDATIREIRSTIYALHSGPDDELPSLRGRVMEVVDAGAEQLGFTPSVRLSGLVDTTVPAAIGEHVLAVLRELLSNAARHAHARRVDVELDVTDCLELVVRDDGVGLPAGGRRSGLRNAADRAESLAGTLTIEPPGPHGGTELRWRVPLSG
jgi:signal transduction histidine kinase